jgi:hypothetical protein
MGKSGGVKKGGGGPKAGGKSAGKTGGKTGGKGDGGRRWAGNWASQGGKNQQGNLSHRAVSAKFTATLREAGLRLAEVERDGAWFGVGW